MRLATEVPAFNMGRHNQHYSDLANTFGHSLVTNETPSLTSVKLLSLHKLCVYKSRFQRNGSVRRLVVSLSTRMSNFHLRPVHTRFTANRSTWWQVFLELFSPSLSVSMLYGRISFIYHRRCIMLASTSHNCLLAYPLLGSKNNHWSSHPCSRKYRMTGR